MVSWLNRFFGSSSESAASKSGPPKPGGPSKGKDSSRPVIVFVLLKEQTFDYDKIARLLSNAKAGDTPISKVDTQKGILTCDVAGAFVALAHMPAPVPAEGLEGPCATSWMWPKGRSANEVKAHKTHLLVTMMDKTNTPIQQRLIASQIIALFAKEPEVMGVYWPEAGMIHFPPLFADMVKSGKPELMALNLWVDFRVRKNPDGSSLLFTQGLAALGLMELEYPKCKMPPAELREWGQEIAGYLMDKGLVLLDGQTIGSSADEKIKIRHTKSQFGAQGNVIRLGG